MKAFTIFDVVRFAIPLFFAMFVVDYAGHHFWLTFSHLHRMEYGIVTFVVSFFAVSRLGYYCLLMILAQIDKKYRLGQQ